MDRHTLDYYRRMLEHALSSPRANVRQLSTMDQYMVLSLRHRIAPERLRAMSPQELFAYAVEQGWISKSSVVNVEPAEVTVFEDTASMSVTVGGKPSPTRFVFTKEGGSWRLDLTKIIKVSNFAMQQAIKESGAPEEEVLFEMLESVSGRKVSERVWQPVGR